MTMLVAGRRGDIGNHIVRALLDAAGRAMPLRLARGGTQERANVKQTVCLLVLLCLTASSAAAEEIRVRNASDKPIYRLFAWATDLTPSTENLIVFPIAVNDIETITIDNSWSDCDFTFMMDWNNPQDLRKRFYVKQDMTVYATNICLRDGKPIELK